MVGAAKVGASLSLRCQLEVLFIVHDVKKKNLCLVCLSLHSATAFKLCNRRLGRIPKNDDMKTCLRSVLLCSCMCVWEIEGGWIATSGRLQCSSMSNHHCLIVIQGYGVLNLSSATSVSTAATSRIFGLISRQCNKRYAPSTTFPPWRLLCSLSHPIFSPDPDYFAAVDIRPPGVQRKKFQLE